MPAPGSAGRIAPDAYLCLLADGTDIAQVALVNGAAKVTPDAPPSYRMQQNDAIANRRGIWATPQPDAQPLEVTERLGTSAGTRYVLEPEEESMGIVYISDAPAVIVDDQPVFVVYGGVDLGWGYWGAGRRWYGLPPRYLPYMNRHFAHGVAYRGYRPFMSAHALAGAGRPWAGHGRVGYGSPGHGGWGGNVPSGGHGTAAVPRGGGWAGGGSGGHANPGNMGPGPGGQGHGGQGHGNQGWNGQGSGSGKGGGVQHGSPSAPQRYSGGYQRPSVPHSAPQYHAQPNQQRFYTQQAPYRGGSPGGGHGGGGGGGGGGHGGGGGGRRR